MEVDEVASDLVKALVDHPRTGSIGEEQQTRLCAMLSGITINNRWMIRRIHPPLMTYSSGLASEYSLQPARILNHDGLDKSFMYYLKRPIDWIHNFSYRSLVRDILADDNLMGVMLEKPYSMIAWLEVTDYEESSEGDTSKGPILVIPGLDWGKKGEVVTAWEERHQKSSYDRVEGKPRFFERLFQQAFGID